MPILEQQQAPPKAAQRFSGRPEAWSTGVVLWLTALGLLATACKRDIGMEAMDSDANGYLCLKCGVKLYTERKVFIGPQCPKCQQESLMDVAGYDCPKDHHLTIRPRRGDSRPLVCEQCQGPLVNAMRSPREKDLQTWGATKFSP